MGLFKALFGGKQADTEEKKTNDEARDFDMYKFDGVKASKMGQFEYAVKCFKAALNIKDDLEVRDYLAHALIHNNELLPAYEQLQKLHEAQPENVEILVQMANVTYMMEDYVAMGHACEKALLIDNGDARVHYLYAKACLGQNDLINAIAMLTKAIVLRADYAEAYLLRGQTLLRMGDKAGAREDMEHLIAEYPEQEDVLMLKGRIEHAEGNIDAALAPFPPVVEVNQFSNDDLKERGQVKYDRGDMEGAKADMLKVMEIDPEQASNVTGEYSAEGIEHKVRQAYSNINPLGL